MNNISQSETSNGDGATFVLTFCFCFGVCVKYSPREKAPLVRRAIKVVSFSVKDCFFYINGSNRSPIWGQLKNELLVNVLSELLFFY